MFFVDFSAMLGSDKGESYKVTTWWFQACLLKHEGDGMGCSHDLQKYYKNELNRELGKFNGTYINSVSAKRFHPKSAGGGQRLAGAVIWK